MVGNGTSTSEASRHSWATNPRKSATHGVLSYSESSDTPPGSTIEASRLRLPTTQVQNEILRHEVQQSKVKLCCNNNIMREHLNTYTCT